MTGRYLLSALVCALLAACAPQQQGGTATTTPATSPPPATATDDAESNAPPAEPSPQAERAEESEKENETAALPTPPPIDDDPQQLMGLDRAGLGGKLGQPELVRHEAPAEIWQYRYEDCVFDIFLYDQRVAYFEARDRKANMVDARGCLKRLLRARMSTPLG